MCLPLVCSIKCTILEAKLKIYEKELKVCSVRIVLFI